MTFVGKILVVAILVASVFFMAIAGMIFATHRNWKAEAAKQLAIVAQRENELANLTNLRKALEEQLANEQSALRRRNGQLESELGEILVERDQLDTQLAAKTQEARDAVAAMKATQDTLADLRDQIAALNTAIDAARKARDEALAKSRADEDALAQVQAEFARLKDRNTQLAKQVALYDVVLKEHQWQLEPDLRVEGVVLDSRDNGMIEVSIGSDDGLEVGQFLEVYRLGPDADTSKYLGRAQVVRLEADRAVAQVIPELRKGAIQRDDRVATRLR